MSQPLRLVIAALFGVVAVSLPQDADLTHADAAFVEAFAHADRAALEKLLDADFTWTTADGAPLTKSAVLRQPPKVAIVENNAESRVFTYGDLADVQVHQGRFHGLRVWVKRPAGWRIIVFQEVMSLPAPPTFTPGAGKDCENPCKAIPFTPRSAIEREIAVAYSKLETAARARNSAAFAPMVGEEFIAASSNSDKIQTKHSRMAEFDQSKDAGVAPTPLLSARMFPFGDAVLMISEHQPDRGKPLHVTRLWVRRSGDWVETLSYQTAVVVPGTR